MQTQTSNSFHNAIMEAGGKDRLPMLAPGNYIQWKSRIKRYIDTKPNHELIHYCLKNPPYKFTCADKEVPVLKGESINIQDLETNLYWEFGKVTSQDGESLESYYLRFYKMMNELVRNQCDITNHQVNVQFLLQLQPEWQREKAIVNYPPPIYDQEPSMVAEDDEMSKDKKIDKLMALISLSFKKIYKPTNNNLRTSSNTDRANQDNSPRINRGTRYDNQRIGNVVRARETVGTTVMQKSGIQCYNCKEFGDVARECQKPKRPKDAVYHGEKMILSHYMYMAQIQEVSSDAADNSGPIFDTEPLQKVQNNDHYNVFAIESEHPEQSKSVHDTYSIEQDKHNVIIDSLDMSYDTKQINHDTDDDDLDNERDLLASLIAKLKCEIDDSKNRNIFLETSNKALVDKLKGEIEDLKTKNKSLESSNNRFKEANNNLSETNQLMYKDLKKFQAELNRRNDVKSFVHIKKPSQAKEAQIKLYKTREDKELDKLIALENKVKVLDNIVYKTGQSVQTMNVLNSKCKTSFAKPKFLKKAQRENPRLYDIGCYNDNLALMLAIETDEVIRLEKESRSNLSDLIRPFDYEKLNNLYDLFFPQHEKSSAQRYFLERSKMSHTPVNNENSKESFNKQTTLLEKRMDESIPYDQKCKSSKELFKIKEVLQRFLMEWNGANKQLLNEHILVTWIHSFNIQLKQIFVLKFEESMLI
nr:hypothetical protein [Tanacetum cinerariifolium]